MNDDIYLQWLSTLQKRQLLYEEPAIGICLHGEVLSPRTYTTTKIAVTEVLVSIPLEEKTFLLVKDLPQNFFLAYTITLGDETQLISVKDAQDPKTTYITDISIFREHKNLFDRGSATSLDPQRLAGAAFQFPVTQTPLLTELRTYLKDQRQLDLETIHMVPGETINLFLPTVKRGDLRKATSLSIPVISLIDDHHYIRDTTVHLYDYHYQESLLQPLATNETRMRWPVHKTSRNHTYQDITTHYTITLPDKVFDALPQITCHNVDLADINELTAHNRTFRLDATEGTIPLYIWRSKGTHTYFPIDTTDTFFQYAGVSFTRDLNALQQIIIQNTNGEDLEIKRRFLHPSLAAFSKTSPRQQDIRFQNHKELLLSLSLSADIMSSITYAPPLHQGKLHTFIRLADKLLTQLIMHSIRLNKFPAKQETTDLLCRYYATMSHTLTTHLRNHEHTPNLQLLLDQSLPELERLCRSARYLSHQEHHLYGLWQNWLLVWSILQALDSACASRYQTKVITYFPTLTWELRYLRERTEQPATIDTIALANKLAKRRPVILYLKEEVPPSLLSSSLKTTTSSPPTLTYRVPDVRSIRRQFPKSSSVLIKRLHRHADPQTDISSLSFPGNASPDDFVMLHSLYESYRIIHASQGCDLLEPLEQPSVHRQDDRADSDTSSPPDQETHQVDD